MYRIISVLLFFILSFCTVTSFAAIVVGNPQGSIILTEIYDYQCPVCHEMYPVVQQLINKNPNLKVRLLPVAVINEKSLIEATAALVAVQYPQGFETLHTLFMTQIVPDQQSIFQIISRIGLGQADFIQAMHSQAVEQQLMEGLDMRKLANTNKVPVFIISRVNSSNKKIIFIGEQLSSTLQDAIDHV